MAVDIQAYSEVLVGALTRPAAFDDSLLEAITAGVSERLSGLPKAIWDLIDYEQQALDAADTGQLAHLLETGSLIAGRPSGSAFEDVHRRARQSVEQLGSGHIMLRYYGGVYFSYRQAVELDAIVAIVRALTDDLRTTGLAAVLGTASDVTSTVGNHFAQPIRPRDRDGRLKNGWSARICKSRLMSAVDGFKLWVVRYRGLSHTPYACTSVRGDYRNVLARLQEGDVGVVYADPPYTRDHYSRFYHVLETLALGDDPGVSVIPGTSDEPSRGLYRVQRHQSPFSIRSEVLPAFSQLFGHCKRLGAPLVLSYSPTGAGTKARPQPRLLTVPQLIDLAKGYFGNVTVSGTDRIAHSKLNRRHFNSEIDYDAEILIIAQP